MGAARVMGIETEYGISLRGSPAYNPMLLSTQLVNAYAVELGLAARNWDFHEESPLRDARGFDLTRAEADPTQLTDEPGMANVILPNGGRFYVDHAHPEYSAPEVCRAADAVRYDRAGQAVLVRAATLAAAQMGNGTDIGVYKNNTDNKGASYGTHENYLMSRRTPFDQIVAMLTPFFVSRQVFTGAGRVGIGQAAEQSGYQISARADFFETLLGLETTLRRPIINTRDEPHADPELHRRLHVIIGDANMSEVATYLKMGITALVLDLLESQQSVLPPQMADPVAALHQISHDPTLQTTVALADGRSWTALDYQWWFYQQVSDFVQAHEQPTVETVDLLQRWQEVLTDLGRDPMLAADRVDWVAKLRILQAYQQRDSLPWSHPRLQLIDLQYADIRPDRGIALKLEQSHRLQRLTTQSDIQSALSEPPRDTRAYFRGECVRRYGAQVAAASWDSVIFDLPGSDPLIRVPTLDPLRGTAEHVQDLLDSCTDARALVSRLQGTKAH